MALIKSDNKAMQPVSDTPYQLDPAQTLRAANALLKKMQADQAARRTSSGKIDLLGDSDAVDSQPIWLCVTTKKHISDKRNLKPGKIVLPHSLASSDLTADGASPLKVCLITADPQRTYKELVDHPNFTAETRSKIARVLGLGKLAERYKSFESRRQLLAEYDVFLADDRIVSRLPKMLGKVFYQGGSKRPVPVSLMGKKDSTDEKGDKRKPLAQGGTKATYQKPKPESIAREIERALGSAYVHLSPGTNTSVKVGTTSMSPEDVRGNVSAVVDGLMAKFIPQGWRNTKGLHIKGPNTASLPIWLAGELWEKEDDVHEQEPELASESRNRKRKALKEAGGLTSGTALEQGKRSDSGLKIDRKRKAEGDQEDDVLKVKAEKKARKDGLKEQKAKALKEAKEKA